ncbi:MAG: WYL domain-containing protein, partial [Candidatus Dormibacteraeota bacterium]|nr:WYL domain-containing protein [Candidatus Dormibacteraeota bacterium]
LRLLVAEPTEIRHWILGWGRTCVVEAPDALREAIAEEAAAMAQAYSDGAAPQPQAGPARDGLLSPQPGRRVG